MNKLKATRAWICIDKKGLMFLRSICYTKERCEESREELLKLYPGFPAFPMTNIKEVEILPIEEVEAMRNEIKELRSILVQFVFESRNCCYENESYKKSEIYLEEKKVYDTLNQAKDKV